MRRRRSALYMPASNERAIAKAQTLPCDCIILDLEDAVAPERKATARATAIDAIRAGGFGMREVVIRINGFDTPWGDDDAAGVRAIRPDAVLVPKVSSVADLHRARAAIGVDGPPLWAMIETCAGILALPELSRAAASATLTVLIAGTNDLAKEMRCRPDAVRTPLLPALTGIVTAARAAGLAALDGVCNALGDEVMLTAESRQGAAFGFDGKTLIHPSQIDAANSAFGPDAAQIAWAWSVIAAFADPANADKGAIRLDGAMVERLHLVEAERIVALAD